MTKKFNGVNWQLGSRIWKTKYRKSVTLRVTLNKQNGQLQREVIAIDAELR
jgi:hypothetical protein